MTRVDPSDVSRRTMLHVAIAGAGVILVQPLSSVFVEPAAAVVSQTVSSSEAEQKAAEWLSKAAVPAGAIRSVSSPSPYFDAQRTEWWFSPTVVKTAYWIIAGATVAATANWLGTHPTPGLTVPEALTIPFDANVDVVSLGQVPLPGALEGIAYTVAKTSEGVAVRAEAGAVPATAILPVGRSVGSLGGPGQG